MASAWTDVCSRPNSDIKSGTNADIAFDDVIYRRYVTTHSHLSLVVHSHARRCSARRRAPLIPMFDPLASSPFAEDNFNPPWPTTPHPPNSPIPNLRRSPHTPHLSSDHDKSATAPALSPPSTAGLYGKEPQIYGQPEQGLISPTTSIATNGTKFEKPEPYLRVRITMLDRNRRDILIKFDAQVLVEPMHSFL